MSALDVQGQSPLSLPPAVALGSRASRAVASVLDGLVVGIPVGIAAVAAGDAGGGAAILLWLLALVLYAPLLMARTGVRNGQTLGKQALGLRVVTTAGVPVTFGIGIKRQLLGQTLPSFLTGGLYSLLDVAWCLWDDRKQTLHDKIASTYVFDADADPALARDLTAPLALAGSVPTPTDPPPPPPPPPSMPGIPTG